MLLTENIKELIYGKMRGAIPLKPFELTIIFQYQPYSKWFFKLKFLLWQKVQIYAQLENCINDIGYSYGFDLTAYNELGGNYRQYMFTALAKNNYDSIDAFKDAFYKEVEKYSQYPYVNVYTYEYDVEARMIKIRGDVIKAGERRKYYTTV